MEGISFTAPRSDPEDMEREREALTEEERRLVDGDRYGKGQQVIEETDELIEKALIDLEEALAHIKVKPEYEEAIHRCPETAQSREFRLKMLRAELFVAKKAADRIVRYWETKVMVWGKDIAYRESGPTLDDLTPQDYDSLLQSKWMLLPKKDKFGRAIIFIRRPAWFYQERKNLLRAAWYIWQAASEDECITKQGVVFVAYDMGTAVVKYNRKLDTHVIRLILASPIRICCGHQVTDNWIIKIMFPFALFMFGHQLRQRMVLHDPKTVMEELKEHGITESKLPREMGGTLDFDFEEWLNDRRRRGL